MIQSVAVLGAGTMGAQIAAHAANAGLPVLLLDVTPRPRRPVSSGFAGSSPIPSSSPRPPRSSALAASTTGCPPPAAPTGSSKRSSRRLDVKHALLGRLEPHVETRRHRLDQHLRHPDSPDRRGAPCGDSPPLSRHALLQPAALPAAGRADPRYRDGYRCRGGDAPVPGRPPGQGRRRRARPARLHREPHRHLRHGADAGTRRRRPVQHRRGGRADRRRDRPSEERDVPHGGHRRPRHPGEGGRGPRDQPEGRGISAAAVRRGDGRRGRRRREGRTRILPEVEGRRRAPRSSSATSPHRHTSRASRPASRRSTRRGRSRTSAPA
jgi:hypothetical protein